MRISVVSMVGTFPDMDKRYRYACTQKCNEDQQSFRLTLNARWWMVK